MTTPVSFTIVTYTPDPIANERVNIGVVVLGDKVHFRFLQRWSRVKSFGNEPSFSVIRRFVDHIELVCLDARPVGQLSFPELISQESSPQETIKGMVQSWSHHIQFTPLRPSLEDPAQLLDRLSARYLVERPQKRRVGQTKAMVTSDAVKVIRKTIDDGQNPEDWEARSKVPVAGELIKSLELDFAIRKEELVVGGGQSVSFQILDDREIHSTWMENIYSLQDIKRNTPWKPLGLAIAPPFTGNKDARVREYDEAARSAVAAGVTLLHPDEVRDWTEEVIHSGVAAD